jgi:hypothetical protein
MQFTIDRPVGMYNYHLTYKKYFLYTEYICILF